MLQRLLAVEGDPGPSVAIKNLIFEHSATGSCQGILDAGSLGGAKACDADNAAGAPPALSFTNSAMSSVVNSSFRDVGGYAITANHATGFIASRLSIRGAGAGGVYVQGSNHSIVSNTWIRDFGRRQPAGAGVVSINSQHAVVEHCDISGGLWNGLQGGGKLDSAAYSAFRFNRVHGNGRETDEGICDYGGIHVSNPGAKLPGPTISDNIFFNITAFGNGGSGIYCDVSSVGMTVQRNLIYGVSYSGWTWNVNPGVQQPMGNPMVVTDNVFVLDRQNDFYRAKGSLDNPAVTWHGYSPAIYQRNVHVVDTTAASSRGAWMSGKPCALSEPQLDGQRLAGSPVAQVCNWDFGENMANSSFGNNVWFNASRGMAGGAGSNTFGGGCPGVAEHNCGTAKSDQCSCRSFTQWQQAVKGAETSLIGVNPVLVGPFKLVTARAALALGIKPLTGLASAGPDWPLP